MRLTLKIISLFMFLKVWSRLTLQVGIMENTISEEIFQLELQLYNLFCNFTELHGQTGKIGRPKAYLLVSIVKWICDCISRDNVSFTLVVFSVVVHVSQIAIDFKSFSNCLDTTCTCNYVLQRSLVKSYKHSFMLKPQWTWFYFGRMSAFN